MVVRKYWSPKTVGQSKAIFVFPMEILHPLNRVVSYDFEL